MKCPSCGMMIDNHHNFCPQCGFLLRKSTEISLKCPSCGGRMDFDEISRKLTCPSCPFSKIIPEDSEIQIERLKTTAYSESKIAEFDRDRDVEEIKHKADVINANTSAVVKFAVAFLVLTSALLLVLISALLIGKFTLSDNSTSKLSDEELLALQETITTELDARDLLPKPDATTESQQNIKQYEDSIKQESSNPKTSASVTQQEIHKENISTEKGTITITVDSVTEVDWDDSLDEGMKAISLNLSVENINYRYSELFNFDVKPYFLNEAGLIRVTDMDGYTLEFYDISGTDNGEYQLSSNIAMGTKARVGVPYKVRENCTSVLVSINGGEAVQYEIDRNQLPNTETPKEKVSQAENDSNSKTETSKTSASVTQPQTTSKYDLSFGFVDYSTFNDYCADGIFRCGSDFEAGEYYIISLYDAQASYEISTDPNDFKWADSKIIRKVNIVDGQYVKAKNSVLVSSNEIKSEYRNQYGIFLIGEDIPSGDYKITSITNRYNSDLKSIIGVDGSYQICNLSGERVSCSNLRETQAYISVEEGQYLIINNLNLEFCG